MRLRRRTGKDTIGSDSDTMLVAALGEIVQPGHQVQSDTLATSTLSILPVDVLDSGHRTAPPGLP